MGFLGVVGKAAWLTAISLVLVFVGAVAPSNLAGARADPGRRAEGFGYGTLVDIAEIPVVGPVGPVVPVVSSEGAVGPADGTFGHSYDPFAEQVAPNGIGDDLLGAACRTNSFVPGTEVLMADGTTKPIEDIEIGDWVWAHDPETGEAGARQVVDTIIGDGEKQLVEIDVLGDTITATDGHPFWVTNDGAWIDAEELEVGDQLLLADGRTTPVSGIVERAGVRRVHNLTVDGIHTYYVEIGDEHALVHNCNFSDHFLDQAALRGVSQEVVEDVIRQPVGSC